MERIAVIGSAGSGKSTLAIELARITRLPLHHLDCIFWKPGWIEIPKNEFKLRQKEIIKSKNWIIDGNYSSTIDIRLETADTIVFLDFSRYICIWRVLKRILLYRNRIRPDITKGCYERIEMDFLKWVWNFPKRSRSLILEKLAYYRNSKNIIHLRHPREVKPFLNSLTS